MSSEEVDPKKLPWYYRLILRFPRPSLGSFSETFQGLFYVILLPIFVVSVPIISLVLLVFLPWPINFVAVGAFVLVVFVIFISTMLERFINAWNVLMRKQPTEWNVDKTLQGYIELLQKKKASSKEKKSKN